MSTILIDSEKAMIALGADLAQKLTAGDIILLRGELGAGKTTLVKGIASFFGIEQDEVVSPTFTLMQVYSIKNQKSKIKNLVHIDTYRLENEDQLTEIGIEDYFGTEDTICLIEWPEKLKTLLKNKKTIDITIEHFQDSKRKIQIK